MRRLDRRKYLTSGYNSHFDGSAPIDVPENAAANSAAIGPYDKALAD
jgi:hypothetical protein